ncbi:DUF4389 domain-containing protein [Streptacidiphilus sp. N1-12]|uniref:DUF4389 domain-containing protein n=2 Tax=Streptacidiphilus alkalitolerans TaxID=3342712 RepID=A0ABV6WNC5_9ACTN
MARETWAVSPPVFPTTGEVLPELDLPEPGEQRRWTVLLRWLLLVPQYIVLVFLGIAGFLVMVLGWFAALVLGRLPGPIAWFLGGCLVYQTRVYAYGMLLVDRYPPFGFSAPDHPVQVELHPTELNRLAVLFRIILLIPAAIVESLVTTGWYAISIVIWLVALVLGRLPVPLFEATAAVTRYAMRLSAYVVLLTPAYPKHLFGDPVPSLVPPRSASRPLILSGAAKALVLLFLLLGLLSTVFSSISRGNGDSSSVSAGQGVHLSRSAAAG